MRTEAFRVSTSKLQKLINRKRRIQYRLRERAWSPQDRPMFTARNIHYELADRVRGLGPGGIGALHHLARRVGLIDALDRRLHLLKIHLPYHESDHVLNVAYNILCGGTCLEDLELRRNPGAPGKSTWTRWAPSASPIRPPQATSAAGSPRKMSRFCKTRSMKSRRAGTGRLAAAAGGVLRPGDPGCGWRAGGNLRRVQGRDRSGVQRHVGLSPAGGLAGPHAGTAVSGQSRRAGTTGRRTRGRPATWTGPSR